MTILKEVGLMEHDIVYMNANQPGFKIMPKKKMLPCYA
jgi:hypothetical protein